MVWGGPWGRGIIRLDHVAILDLVGGKVGIVQTGLIARGSEHCGRVFQRIRSFLCNPNSSVLVFVEDEELFLMSCEMLIGMGRGGLLLVLKLFNYILILLEIKLYQY